MRDFYRRFGICDGDEIVVQKLDEGKYRFLPERYFHQAVTELEKSFDSSPNEASVDASLLQLSHLTNTNRNDTLLSEYCRLARTEVRTRKVKITHPRGVRESAPPSIRKLLAEIHGGKCQVTEFGFTMRSGRPYFEIHHIRPEFGNHLKNVLVVCPNAHAQFTYAFVEHFFDDEGWLRKVKFNGQPFPVRQAIDAIPASHHKELHAEA
jgi:predicted restriction endonuclease